MINRHVDRHNPHHRYEPGVVVQIEDINQYYREDIELRKDKLRYANDLQIKTEEDREHLIDLLTKTYSGEYLDEPINGANILFEDIAPSMWIKPISDGKFMNPKVFQILSKVLTNSGVNIMQYAMDPSYKPQHNHTPKRMFKAYLDLDLPRGMKPFYDHFDEIMDVLLLNSYYKRKERRVRNPNKPTQHNNFDYAAMLVEKYRDRIFCDALPIPSSHAFVMEKRGKNKVSEIGLMQYVFDAVLTATSLSSRIRAVSKKEAYRLDYKINSLMMQFQNKYSDDQISSKAGIMRQNSYGTTTSFNARAVIVSRQGIQKYDEIFIPYAMGMKLLEHHIAKILMDKSKRSPIDIFEMRAEYARQFSPEIHGIMTQLVNDFWGGRGWPANHLRHPYLSTLSSQYMYIPEIGKDPMDNTVQMSPMSLAGPN